MIGLKSKLLAAAAAALIAFSSLPATEAFAAGSYTQSNVYITYDGQVVDTFMGVPARYATYYAWAGEYSCATYVATFYKKFFGVSLYDINNYNGRPHIYYPGHTTELRDVDKPIPGDLVQALDYSHVAIVKEVNGDEITLIEQNWKWNDWKTGKPICTVNRKVGLKDNHYYRLYIDGVEQRLPGYESPADSTKPAETKPATTTKPAATTPSETTTETTKPAADESKPAATTKPATTTPSAVTTKPAAAAKPKIASAKAADIDRDGFTVSVSATGTSLSSVRIGTYLKSKGKESAKWTETKASGSSAKANAKISVSDFGNAGGTYVSVIEITDANGQKAAETIETLIDRTAPVIENVKIVDKTSEGYTVSCTVKDDSPIYAVFFPTYTTANGKDDLPDTWSVSGDFSGSISGNKVTFKVNTAAHGNEYGEYITCIYAYDSFGNCSKKTVKVDIEPEWQELIADRCVISALGGMLASNCYIDIASENTEEPKDTEESEETAEEVATPSILLPATSPAYVSSAIAASELLEIAPTPVVPFMGLGTVLYANRTANALMLMPHM